LTKPAAEQRMLLVTSAHTSFPPTVCFGLATTCSTISSDSYVMKMNALRWFFTRSNGCSTSTIYTINTQIFIRVIGLQSLINYNHACGTPNSAVPHYVQVNAITTKW